MIIVIITIRIDVTSKTNKKKHLSKRFQDFHQSPILLTDQIKIHQSQPLVWPSDLLYVMLCSRLWLVDFRLTWWKHVWLMETLEMFPPVFWFP